VVLIVAVAGIGGLGWLFFGPRKASAALLSDGVQRVRVRVAGGYSPDLIRVRQGVPLELEFDRQESGDCTSRVVLADFGVREVLQAFETTTVGLDLERGAWFGFAFGIHI